MADEMKSASKTDWRLERVEGRVGKLEQVVFEGDGKDNPSLVTFMAVIVARVETVVGLVKGIGKMVGIGIAILMLLIALLNLFGPMIRKALGLPVGENTPILIEKASPPQDASGGVYVAPQN